jgi:ketol-acid reductoisomerase
MREVAILGYGSQGRAWALNLRDSRKDIIVGVPSRDPSRKAAASDGITDITTIAKAVKNSDILVFAFPDHLHGRVFKKSIRPNLNPGTALVFLHGFSVHFRTIVPPEDGDIILLAPLGPGKAVREKYLKGKSIGWFYSIYQNPTGRAGSVLNTLIKALRIDRKSMIKTSFKDEAIGDLFGEQVVLCGGLSQLIKSGFDTLVASGLSPDKAYLEVAYQLDLIVDLIKNHGIEGMFHRISVAARYGSYLTGPKIIDNNTGKKMRRILKKIEKGEFARKLNSLTPDDIKLMNKKLKRLTTPSLERAASKFRPTDND